LPREIRDRTFKNQRYRASGLNLAVAAITLWNPDYISVAPLRIALVRRRNFRRVSGPYRAAGMGAYALKGDDVWPAPRNCPANNLFHKTEIRAITFFGTAHPRDCRGGDKDKDETKGSKAVGPIATECEAGVAEFFCLNRP
jgi:hypothetical protein